MGPVNTSRKDSLARAVRAAGIEAPPVWFDEVGSTNDEARRLAEEGAPEWTVVAASHQMEGRGRLGRTWQDVPGRSLLCSIVLRPALNPSEVHLVPLAAAMAMIEAASLPGLGAKWPNDLVVGDRKCGGILAEAEIQSGAVAYVVVGVGVNVSSGPDDIPAELRETATSLAIEGATLGSDDLLNGFLISLRRRLSTRGFPRGVVDAYRPHCRTLGRDVWATTTSGERIEGQALDLDDRGSLMVEREGTVERVAFGEVQHVASGRSRSHP